ncbi:MAG TPA: 50S ribosomal protein L37e [Candidatus Nanoarchaeia archaeon]|nr:50S ribosomal protein L37e [Candidatus Nanoarchaeia archaeon]
MTKGTASMGRKSGKKSHIRCRRCGRTAYHVNKKKCASCGYGDTPFLRKFAWNKKK